MKFYLTKVEFFFQGIFDRKRRLIAIELLARNFPIDQKTDVFLFFSALDFIDKHFSFRYFKELGIRIHVNLYPSSFPLIDFSEIEKEADVKDVLTIEVLEKELENYALLVKEKTEETCLDFCLDDFGSGSANFSYLSLFKKVKVESVIIKNLPKLLFILKNDYGIKKVVAEKVTKEDLSFISSFAFVDAVQSFALHIPQKFTRENLEKLLYNGGIDVVGDL